MLVYYDQIDSTNRIAKELAIEGKGADIIVQAGEQSAGKGQYGRTFNSPPGGLYFSLILHPDLKVEYLPLITLATGLACRDVVHRATNLHPKIKWPNDIYLEGQKLAGILCENIITGSHEKPIFTVIIGVGLNVNSKVADFPVEVQPIVTTLFAHLARECDLRNLLSLLTTAIKKNIATLTKDSQSILAQWQQHDYLYEKPVVYTGGSTPLQGVGMGVSPLGYYRIQDLQGNEHAVIGGQLRPSR